MRFTHVLLFSILCSSVVAGQTPAAGKRGGGFWQTSGKLILDESGQPVRITGVNWFGLETPTFAPHGLWKRNYKEMLDQIKSLGYNTVRLPFSNQLFEPNSKPNGVDWSRNSDLQGIGGLEIMDRLISHAGKIGLKILLDRHRPDASGQSSLWYTNEYPESRWIADWVMLAERYKADPTVIGADLHNEPRVPACWGCGSTDLDWRAAAQRAGNAILEKNPNWLIIVEGVEFDVENYWWGGNLRGVEQYPVILNVPNRVVYSAHDYPSCIYQQTWFSAKNYPANLPAVWDSFWGYIVRKEIAPVLMGEFGSRLETESDRQWFDALIAYLGSSVDSVHWMLWSWNPNSTDTGGLLLDDWETVDERKQDKLKKIQFAIAYDPSLATAPPPPVAPSPNPDPESRPIEVTGNGFCTASLKIWSDWGSGFNAEYRVTNLGAGPLNGWTVTWTFPGNQKIREIWTARVKQEGSAVSISDSQWNAVVPQGNSFSFGFVADYSGENVLPETLRLNGLPCKLEP